MKTQGIWIHWMMYSFIDGIVIKDKFCKGCEWRNVTTEKEATELWEKDTKKKYAYLSPVITHFSK